MVCLVGFCYYGSVTTDCNNEFNFVVFVFCVVYTMSYRVGRFLGRMFVSLGRSGTLVSARIGGFRISKFAPKGIVQDSIGAFGSIIIILLVLGFLMLIS